MVCENDTLGFSFKGGGLAELVNALSFNHRSDGTAVQISAIILK
jgi:hypothetical protein